MVIDELKAQRLEKAMNKLTDRILLFQSHPAFVKIQVAEREIYSWLSRKYPNIYEEFIKSLI